jgi:ParB family chromosome partitioning protein
MGRGLAAILPTTDGHAAHDELRQVPVVAVTPNPRQPRTEFDPDALERLAQSIAQNGVLQPLLVKPLPGARFELVAGERRLRAAKLAGLETVPAFVRADLDANTLELALIENMARVDLNPIDAARACAALVDDLGLSKEEVARRVGKSRVAVSNLIRLLGLPDDVIAMIEDGQLSEGHGRAILRTGSHESRRRLARRVVAEGLSVRETERLAEDSATAGSKRQVKGDTSQIAAGSRAQDAAELGESFTNVLGVDASVRLNRSGTVRVTLDIASVEDAIELLGRLNRKR